MFAIRWFARVFLALGVVVGLSAASLSFPMPADGNDPAVVAPRVHDLAIRSAQPSSGAAASAPTVGSKHVVAEGRHSDSPFAMIGVTWKSGIDPAASRVEARWRSSGAWSPWTQLHIEPDLAAVGKPGTEPLWVGRGTTDAEVRVLSDTTAAPTGVSLVTVDPGTTPAASSVATMSAAALNQPVIVSRSAWGARPANNCDEPAYATQAKGAVIHHTAGSNSYTAADSAGLVRGIQAYHMDGRGWCDVGYNFLIDQFGVTFEGRQGGTTMPVRAAHSGNSDVNMEAAGIAMMGTFSATAPSAALKQSVVDLVAWRFADWAIPAKGTYTSGGVTLNRISGHRDVVSTECPGQSVYDWLVAAGGLRDQVASKLTTLTAGRLAAAANNRAVAATGSSITFAWDPVPGATQYAVTVGSKALATPLQLPAFTTWLAVNGLTSGQKYWATVRPTDSTGKPVGPAAVLASWQAGTPITTPWAEPTATPWVRPTVPAVRAPGPTPPVTDNAVVITGPSITFQGHGFGHGIGMSQYGARGAALQGQTWSQILAYYYKGTALGTAGGSIRVLLGADDSILSVAPSSTLSMRIVNTGAVVPLWKTWNGQTALHWDIRPYAANPTLSELIGYTNVETFRVGEPFAGPAQFEDVNGLQLILPTATTTYRGVLRSVTPPGLTTRRTLNVLSVDDYTRGVVAREMPASWPAEALKAQATASRTYAVRDINANDYYDICDTTACQVYGGKSAETAATNAAVDATLQRIVTYGGSPAFTQFSSSSGGYTAQGSQPYLAPVSDPWEAYSSNPYATWTQTIDVSTIESKLGITDLISISISKRNGFGDWGGRAVTVVFNQASGATITKTGDQVRGMFGLKSTWYRFIP